MSEHLDQGDQTKPCDDQGLLPLRLLGDLIAQRLIEHMQEAESCKPMPLVSDRQKRNIESANLLATSIQSGQPTDATVNQLANQLFQRLGVRHLLLKAINGQMNRVVLIEVRSRTTRKWSAHSHKRSAKH